MKFPTKQEISQLQFSYLKNGPIVFLGKNNTLIQESKQLQFSYLKNGPVIINYSIQVAGNFEDILVCFID